MYKIKELKPLSTKKKEPKEQLKEELQPLSHQNLVAHNKMLKQEGSEVAPSEADKTKDEDRERKTEKESGKEQEL